MHLPAPPEPSFKPRLSAGFTLVEIAIVLVIIGLIIGGIMVGQDLIKVATIRSQISQIEKYQTAVNTFRLKYNFLPGDIQRDVAAQNGFVVRAGIQGRGDGNGLVEGFNYGSSTVYPWSAGGEPVLFWSDLSKAGLAGVGGAVATDAGFGSTSIDRFVPRAKMSGGNYIYTYSGHGARWSGNSAGIDGVNFFGLAAIMSQIRDDANYQTPGLTVADAFALDQKMDDGIPNLGRVQAFFANGLDGGSGINWSVRAVTASSATCFDTTTNQYSTGVNGGAAMTCALSFQFQ